MERIQKRIAASGLTSRRKAEELILEGRVKVNGEVVNSLGCKVRPSDEVSVDDVVMVLLPSEYRDLRIFPVGRLDYDTKGVILLTNDGNFMNMMVGPKSGIQKEYLVRVKGIMNKDDLDKLENGVMVNGKLTLPAIVSIESIDRANSSTLVRIVITQGMNHQVKEMFKTIGYEVKRLTRVRFGCVEINDLSEGAIRRLDIHEVKTLIELSKASKILRRDTYHR